MLLESQYSIILLAYSGNPLIIMWNVYLFINILLESQYSSSVLAISSSNRKIVTEKKFMCSLSLYCKMMFIIFVNKMYLWIINESLNFPR